MTALLIIGVVAIILILIGVSRNADRPPAPRPSPPGRPAPPDPMIDPTIDPLILPWAVPVPLSNLTDDALVDEEQPDSDSDFTPGGGDFGGGGASGSWDDAGSSDGGDGGD